MKTFIILGLILMLAACSVKTEKSVEEVPVENLTYHAKYTDCLGEQNKYMRRYLTSMTLIHHLYLLEYDHIRDKRLKEVMDLVLSQEDVDYKKADSILQITKIDAKEAEDDL